MKLDGVRVLDLSLFLPGPHLTMLLADHGADVIKVEPPGKGEPTRELGVRSGDASVYFRNTNRGKRSVQLDLKTDAGREALLGLAETADVFVETFRPGVVGRLGIDYDTVAARNERIVYASIAAFGQTGPLRDKPAHDLAIEAYAGVLSLNLGHDGKPTIPHLPVADICGSLMTLSAVLMALYRRHTTGRGDYIDMSMHDAAMAWLPHLTGSLFAEDRAPIAKEERTLGGNAFYGIYETADGGHVVLGGAEAKFARNLLAALGREDLIDLATAGPGPQQDPLRLFLTETFATRTRDEWVEWFSGRDVCFGPVLDLREAFQGSQVAERKMLVRDSNGNLHIGIPMKFRDEPGRLNPTLAALGEHSEEALSEAGCKPDLTASTKQDPANT
ncbi:MAG: CaiB/BaiF CoA-transferase family protein [Pseudomonadota bacterium]